MISTGMESVSGSHLLDKYCNSSLAHKLPADDETEGKVYVFCQFFFPYLCMSLPQWQRGQQSWVSQRSSVPSGQAGASMAKQLTFVAEMNTSSFTLTHCCNTHFSWGDCHCSPTYKETNNHIKQERMETTALVIYIHLIGNQFTMQYNTNKGNTIAKYWLISPHTYLSQLLPNHGVSSHLSLWLHTAGWGALSTAVPVRWGVCGALGCIINTDSSICGNIIHVCMLILCVCLSHQRTVAITHRWGALGDVQHRVFVLLWSAAALLTPFLPFTVHSVNHTLNHTHLTRHDGSKTGCFKQ